MTEVRPTRLKNPRSLVPEEPQYSEDSVPKPITERTREDTARDTDKRCDQQMPHERCLPGNTADEAPDRPDDDSPPELDLLVARAREITIVLHVLGEAA